MVLCGLALWKMSLGESWTNASYDYLFRFGSHAVTNRVVLIQLDNEAYDYFHQTRGQPWDRALHAQLLNRLADDGCAVAVFDSFFRAPRDPVSDAALADALQRQHAVVLMAEQSRLTHPSLTGVHPILPGELFLNAATNWGVAWVAPDLDSVVRRHWPFPSPALYPSLPETVAKLMGATTEDQPRERWLRYYGQTAVWTELSYRFALSQPKGFFRDAIVFIGNHPKTPMPDDEADEFSSPYTRWTGESIGGVDILITSTLNLLNGDWLERLPDAMEFLILAIIGGVLGWKLCQLHLLPAMGITVTVMLGGTVIAICSSYFLDRWFPWLVIVGGQAPCALAWTFVTRVRAATEWTRTLATAPAAAEKAAPEPVPKIPGYELAPAPFGEGAYGKVWLARKPGERWEALKIVYLARFDANVGPYDREFNGVSRYQPFSDQHPGLLRVHFVSEKLPGYFYYIMELGDAVDPDWDGSPASYRPRDLVSVREDLLKHRLPTIECVRIGLMLCDALDFLHRNGLTHRDIKPQNVIFVNGQPRLADVGLIAEIRPPEQPRTLVGTPGYMPPPPETPGTPQADIYALGMVLYVLSTGNSAAAFPELSSTLIESKTALEFQTLNRVILKACQLTLEHRYASAAEMSKALRDAEATLLREGEG